MAESNDNKDKPRRGLRARWYSNQAMRLACAALAEILDTPENELVEDPEKWVEAKAAMKAIRALEPLVFEMTEESDLDLVRQRRRPRATSAPSKRIARKNSQ